MTFKPGQSGNPGGRAKGLERIFREELAAIRHRFEKASESGESELGADGKPLKEMLDGYRAAFRRLWQIAMTGEDKDSIAALKLLFERTYGLPKQKLLIDENSDDEDDEDLSNLSVEELRVLAKVRVSEPKPDDVH